MRDVSSAYKLAVYNRGEYGLYARHFLPYAMLKIIDTAAVGAGTYIANDSSFYSRLSELDDEVFETTRLWGTLEDFQFLLSSPAVLMHTASAVQSDTAQQGWVTEVMSDAAGLFSDLQPQLICRYQTQVSTVGRTLIFNNMYDRVPKDISLQYYRTGSLLATETIENNTSALVTTATAVTRYDEVRITILSTTRPYSRVHLLEDVPGVILEYDGDDIVSLALISRLISSVNSL